MTEIPQPSTAFAEGDENQRRMVQEAPADPYARCAVRADDDMQCTRAAHADDPDAHDFAGQEPRHERVDGGRRWSDWIKMVNNVRGLLMPQIVEGTLTREGRIEEWPDEYCRELLLSVAQAVGLSVQYENEKAKTIRE